MRKLIVWMSISADGYFEGPDRDIGWHRVDEEVHQFANDELRLMGGFLDGRVTHQLMAEFWPTADQQPGASRQVVEFAQIWRDMPKVVYSRTLDRAEWNTTLVREVVAADVAAMKEQPGGDLVVGGADVAATMQRLGLIDEYRLLIHPVVIGAGKPLFPPGSSIDLRLLDSRRFGNGVVYLRYACEPGAMPSG
jgi:dihydrofolate reductase